MMLVEFALCGGFVSSIKCHLMLEEHPSPKHAQATFGMLSHHPLRSRGERTQLLTNIPSHLDRWTLSWLCDILRCHRISSEIFVSF